MVSFYMHWIIPAVIPADESYLVHS